MTPEIVKTNVHCPKCRSQNLLLFEVGTWTSEFKVTAGEFDRAEGFHEPGPVNRLEARCSVCLHYWKIRGADSIDDAVSLTSASSQSRGAQ